MKRVPNLCSGTRYCLSQNISELGLVSRIYLYVRNVCVYIYISVFLSLLLPAPLLPFMSYILFYSDDSVLNQVMARVTNAEDFSNLRSSCQGITFTSGPQSTQNRALVCGSKQHSIKSAADFY